MFSYLKSYLTTASPEAEEKMNESKDSIANNSGMEKFEVEKGDEMNAYNQFNTDNSHKEKKMGVDSNPV